jgi:hypothetical protein
MQVSKIVLELSFFLVSFASQGLLNNKPIVWLEGARPVDICIPPSFPGNMHMQLCGTPTNSGLFYKPMMIVNDDFRVVSKLEASLTDDARVVIYDRHMFIVQAIEVCLQVYLKMDVCERKDLINLAIICIY